MISKIPTYSMKRITIPRSATIFLLFVLALTSVSYAHCGACGEGSAEEHREKGEDYDHHDEEYEKELEEQREYDDEESSSDEE